MHLSDFDLQQLDKARLSQLTVSQKEALLEKALEDLKEVRERLQADSRTSSRPPSSDVPWTGGGDEEAFPATEAGSEAKAAQAEAGKEETPAAEGASKEATASAPKRPGRRRGSPGHSRTQKLPVSETIVHAPEHCALCGGSLAEQPFTARTGLYVLDLEPITAGGLSGIRLRHDKHFYGERVCFCGHTTRTEPGRCKAEPLWTVALSEWHLIGPQLASLIVCLAQRLWVLSSATVCLYFIGYRTKEILANVFGEGFAGWLMSDGYFTYRDFKHRLRCWAHLLRKARGLNESLSGEARDFGQATLDVMEEAMQAIYQAREGPPVDLSADFQDRLAAFRTLCEQHRNVRHEKTRALAREFLNDWEAIWTVLAHPHLPLTNNEAERLLRHWVMVRRTSQGTRTAQGSRALALLASVIETCRKRHILPWPYLAQVIAERRKGNPAPPLPAADMA